MAYLDLSALENRVAKVTSRLVDRDQHLFHFFLLDPPGVAQVVELEGDCPDGASKRESRGGNVIKLLYHAVNEGQHGTEPQSVIRAEPCSQSRTRRAGSRPRVPCSEVKREGV